MPVGERCRRAVCGRTACTVRCGGGRQPQPVGPARAVRPRKPPADPTMIIMTSYLQIDGFSVARGVEKGELGLWFRRTRRVARRAAVSPGRASLRRSGRVPDARRALAD